METVWFLVIGAAVPCLVVIFVEIFIASGEPPLAPDQKPTNRPKIYEQNAPRAPVAQSPPVAATPESSPAVVSAVERSARPRLPRPEQTIPKCVYFKCTIVPLQESQGKHIYVVFTSTVDVFRLISSKDGLGPEKLTRITLV